MVLEGKDSFNWPIHAWLYLEPGDLLGNQSARNSLLLNFSWMTEIGRSFDCIIDHRTSHKRKPPGLRCLF